MVNQCASCKQYFNKNISRSFHRFPKCEEIRKSWITALCLDENKVKSYSTVCSDHFLPNDFSTILGGARVLNKTAIPLKPSTSNTVSNDNIGLIERNSRQLTIRVTPPKALLTETLESVPSPLATVIVSSSEPEISPEEHSEIIFTEDLPILSDASSEATIENNLSEVKPLKKRRKLRNPRYFGDCVFENMATPQEAEKNWYVAEYTIWRQGKIIRKLQQSNKRLKSQIMYLNALLRFLKQKYEIKKAPNGKAEAKLPGDLAKLMKRVLKGPIKPPKICS